MNFSKAVKIHPVLSYENDCLDRNSSIVDCKGYDGICFVVHFGSIDASAGLSIRVEQGDDPGLSDAADVAGSSQAVADNYDDKIKYIDIAKPRKRYLRLVVQKGVTSGEESSVSPANSAESAIAFLYDPKIEPVVQHASVAGEFHHAPAEGTA
jgi:hypothetical protein